MPTPNRDHEHLGKLREYYAKTRRIPTQLRISALMGFTPPAAKRFMERLEAGGYIARTPDDDAWIPSQKFFEYPLVDGSVHAGMPEAVVAVAAEPFYLNEYLVRNSSKTVFITVKGDSMIEAGILDGDLAVVELCNSAKPGDFVVAIVDHEYTLKELATERNYLILKPHNKAYPIIRPQEELVIFGVLIGIVRRYRS